MEIRHILLVGVLVFVALDQVLSQVSENVPVINVQPKKVIRYKLIRMSDEEIKKEQDAKKQLELKDAQEKEWKKKLFPCRDYSPICSRYKNIWNPGVAQCRDVFMQRNCRETCGLCNVPVGVYLGCNDMQHCKALGSNACVHKWVVETCKTMCGSCDGSLGRKNSRVGASSVFVGKKKSIVSPKKQQKVKTVFEAIKNQHKPLEVKENSEVQDKEEKVKDVDTEEQGSAADVIEKEGSGEAQEDPKAEDTESEVEQPKAEEKVEKAPAVQKDAPKKVEAPKKPVHHKKVHHHHKYHHKHHHKHHQDKKHTKKVHHPIKALIKKHKKTTKS